MCNIKLCKGKLIDNFSKTWLKEIANKPKLRTYCTFKEKYKTENYVLLNLAPNERSVIAQLRTGTLPLEIETGRYANKKLVERICKCCNSDIEDETNFLLKCEAYNNVRSLFFRNHVTHLVNSENFILKTLFETCSRQLSKTIIKMLQIRKDLLM